MNSATDRSVASAASTPTISLLRLGAVVFAGEAIFVLPFVLPRLFRPTMLSVWGISNFELGLAFSAYGTVAAVAYFFGGPLADRFRPRTLMASALTATALGGATLMTPWAVDHLRWLYAFFGVTTILLFWAPMIRVTHDSATSRSQGTAFGLLDAGRGLFAAVLASVLSFVFGRLVPADAPPERVAQALDTIILMCVVTVLFATAAVWLALGEKNDRPLHRSGAFSVGQIGTVLGKPLVWLQGIVVLCAYCGYKSIDNYGIFAVDVFDVADSRATWITTIAFWTRPVVALAAGVVADRLGRFDVLAGMFLAVATGNVVLAIADPRWFPVAVLLLPVVISSAAVFGLRGVYFAVFDDCRVPQSMVGTAAGIVSVVGFLPDIFFGSMSGYVIDRFPGTTGHRIVFVTVAVLSVVGGLASLGAARQISSRRRSRS